MGDLLTYSLADFMPMNPETYFRLFERLNEKLWPLQFLALAIGGALTFCALKNHSRMLGIGLSLAWLSVGYFFHFQLFAELNWAAKYFAYAFYVEAALLLVWAFMGKASAPLQTTKGKTFALSAATCILVLTPFLALIGGRGFLGSEVFAIAPDPTALFTLIVLSAVPRTAWYLTVIPILWCLVSGAIWFAMNWYIGLLLPVLALFFMGLMIFLRSSGLNRFSPRSDFD